MACDTSVLVPALSLRHPRHGEFARLVREEVTAYPAHVLLETFSVLTRLPAPHRLRASVVGEALGALPGDVLALPAEEHRSLMARLFASGVVGGAVYDALVAATVQAVDHQLVTADRRARTTYDALDVRYRVV